MAVRYLEFQVVLVKIFKTTILPVVLRGYDTL
jgi:hypothetical protein